MRIILLIYLVLCFGALHASDKDSVEVAKAVTIFVNAFNSFDWPTFRAAFDDDASMFHPTWENAKRIRGRKSIEATWIKIFPEFIDNKNGFRLDVDPGNINIQIYGNTAIVTFLLGDGVKSISRRTVVMVNRGNNWKIVHIHASRIDAPEKN